MLRALKIALLASVPMLGASPVQGSSLPGIQDFQTGALPEMPETGFAEGNFIPDVELPLINGAGTLRLSDYRSAPAVGDEPEIPGKKLLLIHFASW